LPSAQGLDSVFGEVLAGRVAERESQLVIGIDPDPWALWPGAGESHEVPGAARSAAEPTAQAVLGHCRALIDAVAPACVAVKLQLACFERLQAPGWEALRLLVDHAHGQGLLVIADGKRGDVPASARAYSQALFGGVPAPAGLVRGLGVDLATVSPLLGADAIEPFLAAAREQGAAVMLLVRTSNPGAADIEDLTLSDGRPVWERFARLVDELGGAVGTSGLSDVGAVMGATAPRHLARARELMPRAVFLLPGVGAQGGRVEQLAAAFADAPAPARRASALVSASRSIVGAFGSTGEQPARAARAEAERLRASAWALSG
jgi:orotidine-5'-phosphate decarboxylase